jgi:glycosyltransferase involved in cell wall biosynthesis
MTTDHSFHTIRTQDKPVRHFNFPELPETPEPQTPELKKSKAKQAVLVIQPVEKTKEKPIQKLDITAIVVNFKTKHLLTKAIKTFRAVYPNVPLIIIDNNSQDKSGEWIERQAGEHTKVILNITNKGHGPALHTGILLAKTKYVFTFDSDVEFYQGGFLEQMQAEAQAKNLYALGWLRHVNKNGVSATEKPHFCRYIHPYAALYDKDVYLTLKPFVNKGAPCVDNMWDARKKGIAVASYPIEDFVTHMVAGTRRLYKGHWNPKDSKPMVGWNPSAKIPI